MAQLETWIVDSLRGRGGRAPARELFSALESEKPLSQADRRPQKGHEQESTFFYRCRWAATRLRTRRILKPLTMKGILELSDGAAERLKGHALPSTGQLQPQAVPGSRVWIFQANPQYYRILDALQSLPRLNFLTNRYQDSIRVDDVVLLWMSGKYAGIYAEARVLEGVAERTSDGPEGEFWVDPTVAAVQKPRVVLQVERRFLSNPLLKSKIAEAKGLEGLLILKQPNGTNFPVTDQQWALLRDLLPKEETTQPSRDTLSSMLRKARAGRLYDDSCGKILERFVRGHFSDGTEHPRDDIQAWFAAKYPLFKPITVQCHVEKYTTNSRSRVHYNARPEHDLLFRVDADWNRLRLYDPTQDPPPIYELEAEPKPANAGTKLALGRKSGKAVAPIERHRRLLLHLATYGELAPGEIERLAVEEADIHAWLDALLVERPATRVASPLLLFLLDTDPSPVGFTTRLATQLIGEHLRFTEKAPAIELEDYVWQRFGHWHLPQPHSNDAKWNAYLRVPVNESRDTGAAERLDLFAQLPPRVISELIRDPSFLSEQQGWSADAATKGTLGPLSRQMKLGGRRPLFLSHAQLQALGNDGLELGALQREEAIVRRHVFAGLSLCSPEEWDSRRTLPTNVVATRLLENPLHAVVTQFEVHRLFAAVSHQTAGRLHLAADGQPHVDVDGVDRGPLWTVCKRLLEEIGFWPVGLAADEAYWPSAVRAAVGNLEVAGIFESRGDVLQLTESFASQIKAHPVQVQNRGEKPFRVRLLQYFDGAREISE